MLSKLTTQKTTKPIALASMMLAATVAVSVPSLADPYASYAADPIDYEFRASHPFKVFVTVDTQDRRSSKEASYAVRDYVAGLVPSYVVLVSDRRNADMAMRADELDYRLSFHVTDVDQRRKKYKKGRKFTGGQCGIHQRAYYTRITEKGVALADYKLSTRLRGAGSYADVFSVRADDHYRHGQNLRAQTNCGLVPTTHYPNAAVQRLFSRSLDQQRQSAAFDVRQKTTAKLAHVIAEQINARSEQFYSGLAAQYSYAPARINERPYRVRPQRGVYDRDADASYNWQ